MAHINRVAAWSGMIAALSMAATPAAAAELPGAAISAKSSAYDAPRVFDDDSLKAERHRYRYRRHHRHHVGAGDVLAGVLILGGIAAIASAASDSNRDRRERVPYRDYRDDRPNYRDRRSSDSGRGIDGAVDRCVAEIERDVRIDSVDSVDRTGDGWRVTGTIFNGDRFTCRIGEDGRVDDVDFGGGFAAASPVQGRQYSDDRYAAAWSQVDGNGAAAVETAGAQPAYPGGPIDGDLEAAAEDDRYRMAEAPTG